MKCFLRETKLLAAAPFRYGLSMRWTILPLQWQTPMILRQAWPASSKTQVCIQISLSESVGQMRARYRGGSSSARAHHH